MGEDGRGGGARDSSTLAGRDGRPHGPNGPFESDGRAAADTQPDGAHSLLLRPEVETDWAVARTSVVGVNWRPNSFLYCGV